MATAAGQRGRHRGLLTLGIILALGGLAAMVFLSITLGSRTTSLAGIVDAFAHFDPDNTDHAVIRDMRVPRTALGAVVGIALGLSGTILQGVTRNPLADPGIMGINAGAAVFVVGGITLLGVNSVSVYVWLAFLGAGVATVVVYGIGSLGREGATPVKLALAGAAVTAGLQAVTSGVIMLDANALNELRFWQVGSLAGRYSPVLWQVLPFIVVGAIAAVALTRSLNGLALGDEVAAGLGQRVRLTRSVMFATVVILSGAATAACGPIVFLGLVVPHLARMISGPDYR
ncbi:MAG: FecCD family ABC transporter permease, partial [Stackebrandtia sp.]